jgi:alpha-1,3-fucosyltransferase 10
MFYGSKFDLIDLPLPRNGLIHDWALLHEESPKNTPALSHLEALELFNLTATFSRYSHFPLTLQYLKSADVLTGKHTSGLSDLKVRYISVFMKQFSFDR